MDDAGLWIWAKSAVDDRRAVSDWLPLTTHLEDSAGVAGRLWDRWVSPAVRAQVGLRAGGDDAGRALLVFLAGAHDVGKATPVFQAKVPVLAARLEAAGLPLGLSVTADDKRRLPHGLAGQLILTRYLAGRGWAPGQADQLGAVVGGHHGVPADDSTVEAAAHRPDLLGDARWERVQDALLDGAVERSGVDLDVLRGHPLGQPVAVMLTGLVIVADWLASNTGLFPLTPLGRLPVADPHRAESAWRQVSLPAPWRAVDDGLDADALVGARFGISGSGAGARPVQAAVLDAARVCDVPGMLVVEAPMGEGKTEAALLAVEVLAARSGASGCFVALPTQATSNAMFRRVVDWLAHVPDGVVAGDAHRHAIVLAHGKASLDPTFRSLSSPGHASQVGDDEPVGDLRNREHRDTGAIDAYVHWWMTNRKKSPLAEFAVGTIDQLLFLGLQARHLALRHLGMAGKVVVIDEVHSYDAYMSVYLERVLTWLGAYQVPVVMLSATLPPATRARLLTAYRDGLEVARRPASSWSVPSWGTVSALAHESSPPPELVGAPIYPAVTAIVGGRQVTFPVGVSARRSTVRIELADDSLDALGAMLADALALGGCALVVRNTVARAQEAYAYLVGRLGVSDVTLAHSRFLACDRARNDRRLVEMFGPPDHGGQQPHRPERHVVVATQVVEQSLDVDFDLLVTDIAPVDLVLQRIGRLHRHVRARPVPLREARCVVVAQDWAAIPPLFDYGSSAVYEPYALLQSAALWGSVVAAGGVLTLPDDIARLVHAAYGPDPDVPPGWSVAVEEARHAQSERRAAQESRAATFRLALPREGAVSLNGWLGRSIGEADESAGGHAQVRDSDDSIEVLVLSRSADGTVRVPEWVDDVHRGEVVPPLFAPEPDLARAIASCAVRLPSTATRGARGDALIDEIARRWYPDAWQRVPEVRGQLVLVLDEPADTSSRTTLVGAVGTHRIEYDPTTGLRVAAATTGGEPR